MNELGTGRDSVPPAPPNELATEERPENAGDPPRGRSGVALMWSLMLALGRFLIGGGLTFLLAAILEPRSFGVMFMAMVWVAFLISLIHNAATPLLQQPDITDEHFSAAFWFLVVCSFITAGLVWLSAPAIAALNHTPELVPIVHALSPIVILEVLAAVPDSVLRRDLRFRIIAIRGLLSTVIGGTVGVVLALAGHGVWALVAQTLTTSAIYAGSLWIIRPWTPRFGPIREPLRYMRSTSVKSVVGFFGDFASTRSGELALGALFGPVPVGLYRLAAKLAQMITDATSSALSQVSLPDMARLSREPVRFAEKLGSYAHTQAVLAIPLLGLVAGLADPILAVLGPQWRDAATPVRILCLAGAAYILTILLNIALMAAQRQGTASLLNWIRAVIGVVAIVVAAKLTSGQGDAEHIIAIAVAMLATQIVMTAISWLVTFRLVLRVRSRPILNAITPACGAGLVSAGVGAGMVAVLPPTMPAAVTLIVAGAVAGLASAATLLITDALVVQRLRDVRALLGRAKRAVPPVTQQPIMQLDGD
jgi:PST family polysaccharide transporter